MYEMATKFANKKYSNFAVRSTKLVTNPVYYL